MTTSLEGKALVLGDDVNTDELHPSRFFSLDDRTVRSGFLGAVEGSARSEEMTGRIIVAGRNFGIGSSRETGARVFLLSGIRAVVAVSFARIFFRNVSNLGLPAFVCPTLPSGSQDGGPVRVELEAGVVVIDGREYPFERPDPYWQAVAKSGGLAPYLGLAPKP